MPTNITTSSIQSTTVQADFVTNQAGTGAPTYPNGVVFAGGTSFGDGSAASPAITFTADTNTGIFRKAAESLGFSGNGIEVGSYDATGGWTFGVDGVALHVVRGTELRRIAGTASGNATKSFYTGTGAGTLRATLGVAGATNGIVTGSVAGDMVINAQTGNLLFGAAGTTVIGRATQAGAWTLGPTTYPSHTVNGTVTFWSSAANGRINLGASNNYIYGDSSNNLILGTAGTDKLLITSAGAVTLGPTSVSAYSTLTQAMYAQTHNLFLGNTSTAVGRISSVAYSTTGLQMNIRPNAGASGYLSFTENTVADRFAIGIDGGSGNLNFRLVDPLGTIAGTVSSAGAWTLGPSGFTGTHSVNGLLSVSRNTGSYSGIFACSEPTGVNINGVVGISHATTVTPNFGLLVVSWGGAAASIANGSNFASFLVAGGTVIGSISKASNTTIAYNTSSDSRLKTDVGSWSGTAIINALVPRKFIWNTDEAAGADFGFFAQEANEVFPRMVTPGIDNADGSIKTPWSVDYSKITPVLVKAIQELKAELDQAKTEIQLLKGGK